MNEDTIRRYKSNLADEIEPAISELIQRAEQGLASLEKQNELLKTKVTRTKFMITTTNVTHCLLKAENAKMRSRPPIGTSAVQKLEARKLQTLTKQREKLEAEAQALEKEILELVSNK